MKLELTESRIKEIMPYFGYLDEWYSLLTKLNKRSNSVMRRCKTYICKELIKKRRNQRHIKLHPASIKRLKPEITDFYNLNVWIIESKDDYVKAIEALDMLKDTKWVQFGKILVPVDSAESDPELYFCSHRDRDDDGERDLQYDDLWDKLHQLGLQDSLESFSDIMHINGRPIKYVKTLVVMYSKDKGYLAQLKQNIDSILKKQQFEYKQVLLNMRLMPYSERGDLRSPEISEFIAQVRRLLGNRKLILTNDMVEMEAFQYNSDKQMARMSTEAINELTWLLLKEFSNNVIKVYVVEDSMFTKNTEDDRCDERQRDIDGYDSPYDDHDDYGAYDDYDGYDGYGGFGGYGGRDYGNDYDYNDYDDNSSGFEGGDKDQSNSSEESKSVKSTDTFDQKSSEIRYYSEEEKESIENIAPDTESQKRNKVCLETIITEKFLLDNLSFKNDDYIYNSEIFEWKCTGGNPFADRIKPGSYVAYLLGKEIGYERTTMPENCYEMFLKPAAKLFISSSAQQQYGQSVYKKKKELARLSQDQKAITRILINGKLVVKSDSVTKKIFSDYQTHEGNNIDIAMFTFEIQAWGADTSTRYADATPIDLTGNQCQFTSNNLLNGVIINQIDFIDMKSISIPDIKVLKVIIDLKSNIKTEAKMDLSVLLKVSTSGATIRFVWLLLSLYRAVDSMKLIWDTTEDLPIAVFEQTLLLLSSLSNDKVWKIITYEPSSIMIGLCYLNELDFSNIEISSKHEYPKSMTKTLKMLSKKYPNRLPKLTNSR